jgi:integrase
LGEALTLQWDDLDLTNRTLTVRRTWGSRRGEGTMNSPKGNRERRVDVSDQLAETLLKRRDRVQVEALTQGREVTPWVFPGEHGRPILPGAFWQNLWRPVLKAAGVRYRKPHTLRHTFASQLLANGESLVYVKEQLGHHSIRITVDIYGHLVPGSNRQAVNKLDDVEMAQ